jgi:hypothetical protein
MPGLGPYAAALASYPEEIILRSGKYHRRLHFLLSKAGCRKNIVPAVGRDRTAQYPARGRAPSAGRRTPIEMP